MTSCSMISSSSLAASSSARPPEPIQSHDEHVAFIEGCISSLTIASPIETLIQGIQSGAMTEVVYNPRHYEPREFEALIFALLHPNAQVRALEVHLKDEISDSTADFFRNYLKVNQDLPRPLESLKVFGRKLGSFNIALSFNIAESTFDPVICSPVNVFCRLMTGPKPHAGVAPRASQLTTLEINHTRIDSFTSEDLARGLEGSRSLRSFKISDCEIDKKPTQILLQALTRNQTITSLTLSNTNLGAEAAEPLARILSDPNKGITSLNLSNTRLTGPGVKRIILALKENKTLKSLDLSSNKIDKKTAQNIGAVLLWKITPLETLILSDNKRISDSAAGSFLFGLERNPTLTVCLVNGCSFSQKTIKEIERLVHRNVMNSLPPMPRLSSTSSSRD